MDAIELLKNQHQEAADLFERIEESDDPDEKQTLFNRVADALAIHTIIEERHFYPAAKAEKTGDLLFEAVEEHLAMKRVIADLLEIEADESGFDAKIKMLKEQMERHRREEELQLFPIVRRMLDEDQLEVLCEEMQETAADLRAQGAPRLALLKQTIEPAPI